MKPDLALFRRRASETSFVGLDLIGWWIDDDKMLFSEDAELRFSR